ncbi:MAG: DMT family transporter, partial [Candidatus Atribacteria bacterium]|nr:DMT family transporter [Candidatus Atribacteria bacterium]
YNSINIIKGLFYKEKPEDKPNAGILLMILSSICFALGGAMIKYIENIPLMEMVFFRNLPTILILFFIIKNQNISLIGKNKPLLLFRCFFGFISAVGYFYTFKTMTMTDAMTIRQLSPFFIILLATIFLKEKISLQRIPIFLLVFLGALLVIKPGMRLEMLPVIVGVSATIFAAGVHISLRILRLTDHPLVIVYYYAIASALFSSVISVWQNNFVIPDFVSLMSLILLGLFALGAQITLTKAYQMAPAGMVSLYTYSQIIFAAIFGLLFFREFPDLLSILGAFLIIISGYLNYKLKNEN